MFGRIERINAGIAAQRGDGRAYVHVEGDVRSRPRPVGVAFQHRVLAALREFANFEVRKTRRLAFNPVYAVELEPEVTPGGGRGGRRAGGRGQIMNECSTGVLVRAPQGCSQGTPGHPQRPTLTALTQLQKLKGGGLPGGARLGANPGIPSAAEPDDA